MEEWVKSVYSDGSGNYVSKPYPTKGDWVDIQVRMLKNQSVKHVFLRFKEYGIEKIEEMKLWKTKNGLDYYKAQVRINEPVFRYQFYLVTEEKIYYYTQHRVTDYIPDESRDFVILADYHPVKWVKESVFYQIFPDRFCNGNEEISVKEAEYSYQGHPAIQVRDWNMPAADYEQTHALDFYGGDLDGIINKLDYLSELGINAIYLNPIFQSPSVHKYDSLDYYHVDTHLGGDAALKKLIKKMHERGMKLMLDISINHTSSAAQWFNKENEFYQPCVGAYQNPESEFRQFYFWDSEGNYDTWCGVETMPKLNYGSEKLRRKIYKNRNSVLKKWIKEPYGIDGWRFDVADCLARNKVTDVHEEVLKEIRRELKAENPDIYLLAEDWTDCSEDLKGDAWDGTMNYFGCARPIREFVGEIDLFLGRNPTLNRTACKMTAKQLAERITQFYAKLPCAMQYQMFNMLDSHDVTRLYNNPAVHEEEYKGAVIMMFALPGCPSVYYGDEVLLEGRIDSVESCRNPMDWSRKERFEKNYEFYQMLSGLKRNSQAMQDGGFQVIWDKDYVFAFSRFTEKEVIFAVCSTDDEEYEIVLPIENFGLKYFQEKEDYFGIPLKTEKRKGKIIWHIKPHQSYLVKVSIEN
ncbi:MAG: hypothetical protein GX235_02185 [Clostridiales bacterium]|nr:hypothetical protein [Clostridiales bacterium]